MTTTPFPARKRRGPLGASSFFSFPLSPRPKVGEPAELRPGISFNRSFPRCVSSLENRFTSFDCSLGKHTSRSKNKRWFRITNIFEGVKNYYRSDLLQQAETLVTVSPCEFPRDVFPLSPRSRPGATRNTPHSPHFTAPSFDIPENFI